MQRVLIGVAMLFLTTFGSSLSAQSTDQQQNTSASGASSGISDNEFVRKAAEGSMAEVQLGQLASQKAQSPEVKQFAERMVTDHTQANDQLKQAAQGQNITVPTSIGSDMQQEMDRLSKLSGSDFDREYMKMMVQDHQEDLSLFRQEASSGQGALKSFASSMVPKLEEHYRMATDIASKLGASTSSTGDQSGSTTSSASSTSPSSTDTSSSAQALPRSETDTAAPMVNNRTSEHGDERNRDTSSATGTTPSSDMSSSSSSSSTSPSSTDTSSQSSSSTSSSSAYPSSSASSQTGDTSSQSSTTSTDTSSSSSSTDNTNANTNTTQGSSADLPRTASPLPLIGLIGFMSLVAATFLNLRRRLN